MNKWISKRSMWNWLCEGRFLTLKGRIPHDVLSFKLIIVVLYIANEFNCFKKYFVSFNCDSIERVETLQKYFIIFGIYHFIEQTFCQQFEEVRNLKINWICSVWIVSSVLFKHKGVCNFMRSNEFSVNGNIKKGWLRKFLHIREDVSWPRVCNLC